MFSLTILQIEIAKDGTSKKTYINIMNFLGIAPNVLYKEFITNPELKQKIEISERIDELSNDKNDALFKIIEVLKELCQKSSNQI